MLVCVRPGLKSKLLVFSRTGLYETLLNSKTKEDDFIGLTEHFLSKIHVNQVFSWQGMSERRIRYMKLKRVCEKLEREKGESKLTRAFISGYTEHTQKWLFFSQKKMFLFYLDCDIGLPVSIALFFCD